MRLRQNAKVELIRSVPLFSRCTRKELEAIAAEADELALPEGRELTRQGERGQEFIVMVDGSATVVRDGREVKRLGAGDFLGEIALLAKTPRTATVTTASQARVLVLTEGSFQRVTERLPSVRKRVLAALAERIPTDEP